MSDERKSRKIEMLLAAYRPDGSDADDPEMREALARVEDDDELRALFEDSQAFDKAVASALASIPVPKDLRDEIEATLPTPVSAQKRPSLIRRVLPIAAVLAVSLGTTVFFTVSRPNPEWEDAPISFLNSVSDGEVAPDMRNSSATATMAWLQKHFDVGMALPVSLTTMPARICAYETGDNGKIALVVFNSGDGTSVHLLIQEKEGVAVPIDFPRSCSESDMKTKGDWEMLRWASAGRRYLLAANMEHDACRKRLRELAGIEA